MNQLGELAYQIWDVEFGTHSTEEERRISSIAISGYLDANIGQLNTFINTDFKVHKVTNEVVPPLKYEEKAIFTQLYLKDYNNRQARNILSNAAATSTTTPSGVNGITDWVELREGDTSIKRALATATSKNTSAQIFQKAAVEANALLKDMIHAYNMYGAIPLQVAGVDGDVVKDVHVQCPTPTPSRTPSPTATPSISISPTATPSATVTPTITPTVTVTATTSITPTVTPSITPSITVSPSITPSITVSPSISITPTVTPSITPSITVTPTATSV